MDVLFAYDFVTALDCVPEGLCKTKKLAIIPIGSPQRSSRRRPPTGLLILYGEYFLYVQRQLELD